MGNNLCRDNPKPSEIDHPNFSQATKLKLFQQIDLLKHSKTLSANELQHFDNQLTNMNLHDLDHVISTAKAPLWSNQISSLSHLHSLPNTQRLSQSQHSHSQSIQSHNKYPSSSHVHLSSIQNPKPTYPFSRMKQHSKYGYRMYQQLNPKVN